MATCDRAATDALRPERAAVQAFEVTLGRRGDAAVVTASGELDLLTNPSLLRTIEDAFRSEPARLILDLRGLTFFGATGMRALVIAGELAARRGVRLFLLCAGQTVRRPLDIAGLLDRFEIRSDPTQAT